MLDQICASRRGSPSRWSHPSCGSDGRLPVPPAPGMPNFLFPEACAAVLARAVERRAWLSRPLGEPPWSRDIDADGGPHAHRLRPASNIPGGWHSIRSSSTSFLATHGVPLATVQRADDLPSGARERGHGDGRRPRRVESEPAGTRPSQRDSRRPAGPARRGRRSPRAGRSWGAAWRAAGQQWHGAIVQPLAREGGRRARRRGAGSSTWERCSPSGSVGVRPDMGKKRRRSAYRRSPTSKPTS